MSSLYDATTSTSTIEHQTTRPYSRRKQVIGVFTALVTGVGGALGLTGCGPTTNTAPTLPAPSDVASGPAVSGGATTTGTESGTSNSGNQASRIHRQLNPVTPTRRLPRAVKSPTTQLVWQILMQRYWQKATPLTIHQGIPLARGRDKPLTTGPIIILR